MNDAYQNEIAKACVTIYPGLHTAHASEKMELPLKFLATGTRVHTPSIFPRDSLIQPVPLQAVSTVRPRDRPNQRGTKSTTPIRSGVRQHQT